MQLFKLLKLKESSQRAVSIDFGASFIKVACVETSGAAYRLVAYALSELDASQKTSEDISEFLKKLLAENLITAKEVSLSISDPDWIFIKKLTLPVMPKEELLNAVKWQLKGQLPFSADDSVSDLQVIREYADSEAAKKVELFCVFAKKDIINKYISVVNACGLTPIKISSSVFNYCGILNLLPTNPEISAILDIGHTHSQVSIYQKNKLTFVRDLNFSTSKLTASLVGALLTDNGILEINTLKADALLQKFGIPLDESQILEGGIKASQVISLIRPLLETVAKELSRSFDYFKSESGLDIPQVLYLTGGGANLKNFDSYLASALKMKVQELLLPELLDIGNLDKDKLSSGLNQLSSAIGLSLSESNINLLPREIKNRKMESIQKTSLRITAIVIGAVFAFSWFVVNFQINDYKKRLKIAKSHLQSVEEIKNLKQLVDSREEMINTIHTGKVPSGGLLKLVSSLIPPGIILDEFSFNQASHSMLLKGIVILGNDSVEKVLTDFMKDMEDSKFINEANLISSKEDAGVNNFEIECDLAR
ncbi:MAG: pilus assembly protein PilM [Candidatus Omnitrophica bacterium]|jgi:type IV pilus assembly protein PilM|nr:pilus assembly protein PilM [Candidatus Omnitrophota bacterium]